MAASVHSPSPPLHNKESTSLMVSPPLFSPASDKHFWSKLRTRIDSILENRQRKMAEETNVDPCSGTHFAVAGESDGAKRMKEDSLLLLRGFDSVAQNLSQLSSNLGNALQGARHLAEPPTLREIFQGSLKKQEDLEEQQNETEEEEEKKGLKRKYDPSESLVEQEKDNDQCLKDKRLKKVRNLALSTATKSAALARELKSIKSNLCFVQERCALLEEENKRLRDGFCGGGDTPEEDDLVSKMLADHWRLRDGFCGGGDTPEEDDLMRLQMEVLLAEKSRLANENANLFRENRCLHQLVEYHQITSQDLSASYDQLIQGVCLDFSSPDEAADEDETAEIPTKDLLGSTSLDGCFREVQEQ